MGQHLQSRIAFGGYFNDLRVDWTSTAHPILTTDGIRGRDKLGDGQ